MYYADWFSCLDWGCSRSDPVSASVSGSNTDAKFTDRKFAIHLRSFPTRSTSRVCASTLSAGMTPQVNPACWSVSRLLAGYKMWNGWHFSSTVATCQPFSTQPVRCEEVLYTPNAVKQDGKVQCLQSLYSERLKLCCGVQYRESYHTM